MATTATTIPQNKKETDNQKYARYLLIAFGLIISVFMGIEIASALQTGHRKDVTNVHFPQEPSSSSSSASQSILSSHAILSDQENLKGSDYFGDNLFQDHHDSPQIIKAQPVLPACIENELTIFNDPNSGCLTAWPNATNCSYFCNSNGYRWALTNSVPTDNKFTGWRDPYCPFGVGKGYCLPDGATNCSQFYGMVCPAQEGAPPTGDVIVPQIIVYRFPLNPDPTNNSMPLNQYQLSSCYWAQDHGNNVIPEDGESWSQHGLHLYAMTKAPPVGYQTSGLQLTGQQIKGPAEASGMNVDLVGLEFECGGHITPPLGAGPLWHFHKASLCLDDATVGPDNTGVDAHSALLGWANDGFGIYGQWDVNHALPTVDQCNGHFGPIGLTNGGEQIVKYHYHIKNFTMQNANEHFEPYWIGCLGPSKGNCNQTVNVNYDDGANWCGTGCGFEICVEPGTDKSRLDSYLNNYPGGAAWLNQFTVNPF